MLSANLSAIFYLISGVLFILALRGLSSPVTSRQGNLFGIIGMVIAIGVTFLSVGNFSTGFLYVLGFLLVGGSVGAFIALIFLEILIKARFIFLKSEKPIILVRAFDMFRIGLTYGLFSEGLKLL